MSSVEVSTVVPVSDVKTDTSLSKLKELLVVLSNQSNVIKTLTSSVRGIVKDLEKQNKELEKYRNKKYRNTSERKSSGAHSGITKPVVISEELSKFIGTEPGVLVARNEVTRKISAYVRENNLSDPTNRQKFVLNTTDEGKKLGLLLGNPDVDVSYFNLQKYIKHHYIMEAAVPPVSTPVVQDVPVVPVVSEAGPSAPKKKVIVMKKVITRRPQLNEE